MSFKASRMAAALIAVSAPLALFPATAVQAVVLGSTSAVNVDKSGLALRGYDPVAYFETGKPTPGVEAISATFSGARYLFASEAHRSIFMAAPQKYAPQFGGFCAVGTAFGEKVDADPQTGKVVDGKLYVNFSPKTAMIFDKDTADTITRAEKNWSTVKDKVSD